MWEHSGPGCLQGHLLQTKSTWQPHKAYRSRKSAALEGLCGSSRITPARLRCPSRSPVAQGRACLIRFVAWAFWPLPPRMAAAAQDPLPDSLARAEEAGPAVGPRLPQSASGNVPEGGKGQEEEHLVTAALPGRVVCVCCLLATAEAAEGWLQEGPPSQPHLTGSSQ